MKLPGKAAIAHRRINSLRYSFYEDKTGSRGLSGEHIKLCAEGARRNAESLRQTDGEVCKSQGCPGLTMQSSYCVGAAFYLVKQEKEGTNDVR